MGDYMAKEHKGKSAPGPEHKSSGKHGGNRAGDQHKKDEQPKKSSQAAGQDPHRGKRETTR
jgi:hypothetical protein